jgi:hypothetical protein
VVIVLTHYTYGFFFIIIILRRVVRVANDWATGAAQECLLFCLCPWSQGSSVSIISDYGLDDQVIEVRSPAGAEDFSSSPCDQTNSGAHPASYTMGIGCPFPKG